MQTIEIFDSFASDILIVKHGGENAMWIEHDSVPALGAEGFEPDDFGPAEDMFHVQYDAGSARF